MALAAHPAIPRAVPDNSPAVISSTAAMPACENSRPQAAAWHQRRRAATTNATKPASSASNASTRSHTTDKSGEFIVPSFFPQ
jgi:hypothetical protein